MSSSGGDGGRRRSSRLEKGKAVVYAMSLNTDDEYKSMEGPPSVVAATAGSAEVPTGGGSVAPRRVAASKRRRASYWANATPETDPEFVELGKRYPLKGGIKDQGDSGHDPPRDITAERPDSAPLDCCSADVRYDNSILHFKSC
uniref:Uncharacterized protein n=1 Tax=Fagus sylvatica TaxID=28930 RepID=A0A2N9F5Y5_FAGSY